MKAGHLIFTVVWLSAAPVFAEAVVAETGVQQNTQVQPALPEGEKLLRQGILMLVKLHQIMAGIKDNDTAEAAVPEVMRLCESLRQWPQGFTKLPPISEPEAQAYEENYLPIIRKINTQIEAQADRIAAAEYYGSRNLPAALVRLAQIN